jgi:uncharacterized RDD family membrane protein YckC
MQILDVQEQKTQSQNLTDESRKISKLETKITNAVTQNNAGFIIRFQAQVIDILINLSIIVGMWYLIFKSVPSLEDLIHGAALVLLLQILLLPFLFIVYTVLMLNRFGGTIGKLLSGIKVVNLEAKNLTVKESLFRYLVGYFVSGVCYGLGFLWVLRDKEKKGWHDHISNTKVIYVNKSISIHGCLIVVTMIVVNVLIISSLVQSIKVHTNLHKEIYDNIQLWESPALENNKPAGTIEPNSKSLLI